MLVILGDDGGSVSVMMIRGSDEGPSRRFVKARTIKRYFVNGAENEKVQLVYGLNHRNGTLIT